jgi:DNA damage-inducible protein 1
MPQFQVVVLNEQTGDMINLGVEPDENIENLKALIEVETRIPLAQQHLFFEGKELQNNETLVSKNIKSHEIISLRRSAPQQQQRQQPVTNMPGNQGPGFIGGVDILNVNAQQLLQIMRQNQPLLQQIQQTNPQLHQAVMNNDSATMERFLKPLQAQERRRRHEAELYRRLDQNPFDLEAQQLLEQEIKQRNIQENMENAIEYTPESFGRVVMLYIDCQVNKVPLKAFVDSGAQMTIMSKECALKCNIMHLIDERFSGIAKGVGTAKIIGRIHLTTMVIGNTHFPITITVLDQGGMEFLLGLDMLRRHHCMIDLKENCLHIGDEKPKFLSEGELPSHIRQENDLNAHDQASPLPRTPHLAPTQSPFNVSSTSPPENAIKTLIDMGFDRDSVIEALRVTNNNVEMAASYLMQSKFGI